MPWIALAALLLALPGLASRRGGPLAARLAAVLALCALWVASLDPRRPETETEPARLAWTATAEPPSPEQRAALEARLGLAGDDAVLAGSLPARLQAAALRAGVRQAELLLLWTGPIDPVLRSNPSPVARPFTAVCDLPPLPVEPASLSVASESVPARGRPGLLSVAAAGLPQPVSARLRVRDPQGAEALDVEVFLPPSGRSPVAFTPSAEGLHQVELELSLADAVVRGRGALAVGPPPAVAVVGARAVELAPALSVQGLRVEAVASLPADLDGWSAVVLLDRLEPGDQERLALAMEDGLGVLVDGPAMPAAGEPLYAVLPVTPEPAPVRPAGESGPGDTTPEQEPPEAPPSPPEVPPDRPPTGETGDAIPEPGPEVEVDKRAIALVLVIDRSGSMGEVVQGANTKMDYAKRSAYETARALGEGDLVGIVTFGNPGAARVELPMTPATDERTLRQRIEQLAQTGDRTFLASGLRRAGELLAEVRLPVKHVVVISDGQFHDAELTLPAIARQLRQQQKATVSIIQVMQGTPNPLFVLKSNRIVKEGGGVFHLTQDPTKIPMLVSMEVTRALDRVGRRPAGAAPDPGRGEPSAAPSEPPQPPEQPEPATEPPERPQPPEPETSPPRVQPGAGIPVRAVSDSPLLEPRPERWPEVFGLVPARGRHDARILLVAGAEGRPLLGFANRGLGRIAAWTADLAGPWGAAWRRDPAFPGRLAAWVQALLRPQPGSWREVLDGFEVRPPRPAPSELAALARWGGGPVVESSELAPPGPRLVARHRGRAAELALLGAMALLLLALVEFLAARRG